MFTKWEGIRFTAGFIALFFWDWRIGLILMLSAIIPSVARDFIEGNTAWHVCRRIREARARRLPY